MNYTLSERLDLNEENVKKILTYCYATKQTPKENVVFSSFVPSNKNIPKFPFDMTKLEEVKNSIRFMLGQLKALHSKTLIIKWREGYDKYTGKKWTESKYVLFTLYYLGVASNLLSEFVPDPNSPGNYISRIDAKSSLERTFIPKEYELWLKHESFGPDKSNEEIAWINSLSEEDAELMNYLLSESNFGIDFAISRRLSHNQ